MPQPTPRPHVIGSLALALFLLACHSAPTSVATAESAAPVRAVAGAAPQSSAASAPPPVTDSVPTTLYTDPATGVRFRYPSVWQSGSEPAGYLPAAILDDKRTRARVTVTFSPKGNFYEKTNLSDLSFTFAVADVPSAAACHDLVANNSEIASPVTTVRGNNNVAFTEAQGGDAGMSHALAFTLDSTFHNERCLIFERDEATLSPGVEPGTRALTPAEDKALQKHLDAIFRSVTLP